MSGGSFRWALQPRGRGDGIYGCSVNESALERFLTFSGFTESALRLARPKYGRWLRQLAGRGVSRIPGPGAQAPEDAYASNLICLMIKQGSPERTATGEHELRNLTEVRPFKA